MAQYRERKYIAHILHQILTLDPHTNLLQLMFVCIVIAGLFLIDIKMIFPVLPGEWLGNVKHSKNAGLYFIWPWTEVKNL